MEPTIEPHWQCFDPFRRPASNWARVVELAASGKRAPHCEEPIVRRALAYLRAVGPGPVPRSVSRVPHDLRDIAIAYGFHQADGYRAWQLQALLLTELTFDQIAVRMSTTEPAIAAFEALFFHVRDNGRLRGWDWIFSAVLTPPRDPTQPPESLVWQYFALGAGPLLVDLLVEQYLGLPCADPAQRANIAAQARLLTRWHFTPWSDFSAWSELIGDMLRQRGRAKVNRQLTLQLRSLRAVLETQKQQSAPAKRARAAQFDTKGRSTVIKSRKNRTRCGKSTRKVQDPREASPATTVEKDSATTSAGPSTPGGVAA